jgi:uncharacterized membrane protein (DUF373 family)
MQVELNITKKEEETMTDKHLAKKWILSFARFVEVTVGVIVAIALVISCISLFINLGFFDGEWVDAENFNHFLESALNIVLGVEFIRMVIKHNSGATIEVLMIAVARHLLLDHTDSMQVVLGVAAIAGIFAIRKFLFVESFSGTNIYHIPADKKVRAINQMFDVKIPCDPNLTIGEVMGTFLDMKGEDICEGASIVFPGIKFTIISLALENVGIIEIELTGDNH